MEIKTLLLNFISIQIYYNFNLLVPKNNLFKKEILFIFIVKYIPKQATPTVLIKKPNLSLNMASEYSVVEGSFLTYKYEF